ncbi:MAG TPA: hypothetical protein VJM50_23765 [Pyrinomonadaceae bacterium]|nr:hypothetical protein [Pyrinomonadaceae bacterium]
MTRDEFNRNRSLAIDLYATQGDTTVSLDAIFIAVSMRAARQPNDDGPPPEWFTELCARMSGQAVTVSKLMMMAGRFPVSRQETLKAGRWLRSMGKEPRKTGGKQLYLL